MLNWLREKLRKWLVEEPEVRQYIDCLVSGKAGPRVERFFVTGAHGLLLVGTSMSNPGREVKLISEAEAMNRRQFKSLFQQFAPKHRELRWEDGTEYEASKQ